MATDFLVKQGRVMGGVRLVTDADVAHQTDLTNIRETGTTSSQAILAGTYFYLNNVLVRAKVDIANGATFTLNTNYEVATAGALNELKDSVSGLIKTYKGTKSYTCPSVGQSVDITFTLSTPTGYKCIGIMSAITNTGGVLCNSYLYNNDQSGALAVTNIGNTGQAGTTRTAQWTEVYVKDFS